MVKFLKFLLRGFLRLVRQAGRYLFADGLPKQMEVPDQLFLLRTEHKKETQPTEVIHRSFAPLVPTIPFSDWLIAKENRGEINPSDAARFYLANLMTPPIHDEVTAEELGFPENE